MTTLTTSTTPTPSTSSVHQRPVLRWLLSFAGFPLGGFASMILVGAVDSPVRALLGGLLSGAVLGAVQAWALGLDRHTAGRWLLATAAGLAAGLTLGSAVVGFETTMADLAVQGVASGAAVGFAQALVVRRRIGRVALLWPAYLAGVWALGWTVTTAIGVEVDDQFTVVGSAGAVAVAALTTVLPWVLHRTRNH